jgi:hypothetical protein
MMGNRHEFCYINFNTAVVVGFPYLPVFVGEVRNIELTVYKKASDLEGNLTHKCWNLRKHGLH